MDIYRPSHCFCRYDVRDLVDLAREKLVRHVKTVDLMREAHTDAQRSRVAIVSLLDLDDQQVLASLNDKTEGPNCHILSCRDMLRKQLEGILNLSGRR
jgi:hypothetical protein